MDNFQIEQNIEAIRKAEEPLLYLALDALKRAAERARMRAIECNTDLVLWENGRVVHVPPNDLREEAVGYSTKGLGTGTESE